MEELTHQITIDSMRLLCCNLFIYFICAKQQVFGNCAKKKIFTVYGTVLNIPNLLFGEDDGSLSQKENTVKR